MITFERPEMMLFLFLVPMVILIHLVSLYHFKKKAFKFANFETLQRLHDDKAIFSKRLPSLFLRLFFIVTLVLAVSGMAVWLETEGLTDDIILAIDASGSMVADDVSPSRLGATKEAIAFFIENSSSASNIGIISFTSLAYLEQAPTIEKMQLLSALDGIDIRKSKGTSIGAAINFANLIFDDNVGSDKKLIIFTDGQENVLNDEEMLEVISDAQERNIKVSLIGVGSVTGAPIEEGAVGKSVVNEDTLKMVAEKTGGTYKLALDRSQILDALNSSAEKGQVRKRYDLTIWLYMLSFVVLIIEWYFSNYIFRSFP